MTEHFRSRTQRYLAVILRVAIIAVVVFALTTFIGGTIIDNVLTRIYTAKATIAVKPRISLDSVSGADAEFSADFQVIESPDVLQPVITDLSLDRIWAERVFRTGEPLAADDALKYLEKNLHLNYKHGTDVVEILVTSDDPKEAADMANDIADNYKKVRDADDAGRALRGRQVLSDEIVQQQKVVDGKRAEVQKWDAILSPGAAGGSALSFGARLKDLEDAKTDVAARDAFFRETATLPDDQFFHAPGLVAKPDPDAARLQSDILKAEVIVTNLLTGSFRPSDHDKVILAALQREISTKKAQLHVIAQAVQRKMQADLDLSKSRLVLLQKEVDEAGKRNPDAVKAYQAALADLEQQTSLLAALTEKQKENELASAQAPSSVRILTRADVPTEPSEPNLHFCYGITYALAGLLSILIPCSLEVVFLISRAAEDADRDLLPAQ
jgi:uncharacterized protein involved in exopolysaccharide biosynthesis